MNGLSTAIPAGLTAFTATNIDDLVILTLFFAQVNATFRRRHIVAGQYLGFTLLVLASLPGFFGSLVIPKAWIGLLGLAPIAIGLNRLLNGDGDDDSNELSLNNHQPSFWSNLLSPQACGVAAITVANGSDNISIYVPLFANSNWVNLLAIVAVFLGCLAAWCYAAYKFANQPAIANLLARYGNIAVPFFLIGLGAFIVWESGALSWQALLLCCLCLSGLVKKFEPSPEKIENN